ncbi:MAG: penicillin-binding protein 2, partial [Clostridia bacterium]|nr:penicillin-binding protein 2 [Clostridia bacterium]
IEASDATFANLSFGQGNLLATPVHVAGLAAAAVNDGVLYPPTLYLGEVDETGILHEAEPSTPQRVFSASTAAILRDFMRYTMIDGTGEKGQPFHLGAGAKTGTAETGWYEDGVEVVQHWFTGFYPAQDPRYVVVTLAENSEASGESAAPVFRDICEALYRHDRRPTG